MPAQQIGHTLNVDESADAEYAYNSRRLPWVGWRGLGYALKRASIEFWLELGFDAASMLTYYTVLTCAPALLAIYSIATLVLAGYTEDLQALTNDFVEKYIPTEYAGSVRDVIDTIIGSSTGGMVALIIGIGFALISSSAYTRAFSRTANAVYGISEGRTLIRYHVFMVAITLLLLVGTVSLLIAIIVNGPLVNSIVDPIAKPLGIESATRDVINFGLTVWGWLRWPFIIVMSMALVGSLYYFTPNVKQRRFRWLSTGSFLTIVSTALVVKGLSWYLFNFAAANPYGAMGAVIAVMTALWTVNVMILFGFKLDAEIERVRQLKAGLAAEEFIQLPPRDATAAAAEGKTHRNLREQAHRIREASLAEDAGAEGKSADE